MGRRQCLPLSVVQLKGKHCRRPITVMEVAGVLSLSVLGVLADQLVNPIPTRLCHVIYCSNVSTTPLRQWGFRQCLSFSWTTLRGKHCRHPIAVMGVVDTVGPADIAYDQVLGFMKSIIPSDFKVDFRNNLTLLCRQPSQPADNAYD